MYIGDVRDGTGLDACVWEITANAIDQHLAGTARRITCSFDEEGAITIGDDGPGFSLFAGEDGVTMLERAVSALHATATLDNHFPHVHLTTTLTGCGLASVAAVARSLAIETVHGDRFARITMERGQRSGWELGSRGDRPRGTRVRFAPDPSIFTDTSFHRPRLRARAQEMAYWLPQLTVLWEGAELPGIGGCAEWLRATTGAAPLLATRRPIDDVVVDLALGYGATGKSEVRSWVNLHRTREGTHERGLFDALVAIARDEGARAPRDLLEPRLSRGLVALVHVWMLGPEFGAPTRDQLRSPIARSAVARAIVASVAAQPLDAPIRQAVRARC